MSFFRTASKDVRGRKKYVCWLKNNQIGNVPNSYADVPNTIKTKRNQTFFDIALKQGDRK